MIENGRWLQLATVYSSLSALKQVHMHHPPGCLLPFLI